MKVTAPFLLHVVVKVRNVSQHLFGPMLVVLFEKALEVWPYWVKYVTGRRDCDCLAFLVIQCALSALWSQ